MIADVPRSADRDALAYELAEDAFGTADAAWKDG